MHPAGRRVSRTPHVSYASEGSHMGSRLATESTVTGNEQTRGAEGLLPAPKSNGEGGSCDLKRSFSVVNHVVLYSHHKW